MKIARLGATGRFPQGQVDAHDEGELQMAIAVDRRNAMVRVEFGTPVAWLGLPAREARTLGEALIEKAAELDKFKK